ncbi:hypothetical protein LCM10_01635 [Rossellomorea aquimaris]|uniref:hypothetical protein n=1 Tax=Rossellomorea aquimaris TaxID=189382 RepID=UPI001CD3BA3B|nr:hypothetical protein [Rossellomorea aquimaris]MCA1053671.1 hypothetical protein [Rossellomorea aquimaris]
MKRNLSRSTIEILSIRSAQKFCDNMEMPSSISNLSMLTGFSEERILELMDIDLVEDFPFKLKRINNID